MSRSSPPSNAAATAGENSMPLENPVAAKAAGENSGPSLYRPELDWLRFMAFFAVFLHHTLPQQTAWWVQRIPRVLGEWAAGAVRSGGYGVDVFFTLSAFLITDLLLREQAKFGRIDIFAFYMRRLLRIWPLYFLFLAFAATVPTPRLPVVHVVAFALFLGNWSCAFLGFPKTVADLLWSISIEEQFYLAWPPLLRFVGRERLLQLVVGLIAIAWATRGILIAVDAHHPAIWCNTFARLDPIALGILVAYKRPQLSRVPLAVRFALVASGVVLIAACGRADIYDGPGALFTYPVVAVASTGLLLGFLDITHDRQHWVRLLRPVAYLGKISYGLYVLHTFAAQVALRFTTSQALFCGLALIITIGLAIASFELFESPFLHLKRRFTRIASRP